MHGLCLVTATNGAVGPVYIAVSTFDSKKLLMPLINFCVPAIVFVVVECNTLEDCKNLAMVHAYTQIHRNVNG